MGGVGQDRALVDVFRQLWLHNVQLLRNCQEALGQPSVADDFVIVIQILLIIIVIVVVAHSIVFFVFVAAVVGRIPVVFFRKHDAKLREYVGR